MVNIFTIIICEIDQGKELPCNLQFYLKYTIFCLFYFLTPQHTKLPTYFYNLQCDTKNVSPFFFFSSQSLGVNSLQTMKTLQIPIC